MKVANIIFVSVINKVYVMHLWSFKCNWSILVDKNWFQWIFLFSNLWSVYQRKEVMWLHKTIMQEIKVRRFWSFCFSNDMLHGFLLCSLKMVLPIFDCTIYSFPTNAQQLQFPCFVQLFILCNVNVNIMLQLS